MKLAGLTKLKRASTPFCPDGTLLAAEEEAAGELEKDAASQQLRQPHDMIEAVIVASSLQGMPQSHGAALEKLVHRAGSNAAHKLELAGKFPCKHPATKIEQLVPVIK